MGTIVERMKAEPNERHLVWADGMSGWTDAKDVPEIAAAMSSGPPPVPSGGGGPPPPPPPA